jgi:hypothetical protein
MHDWFKCNLQSQDTPADICTSVALRTTTLGLVQFLFRVQKDYYTASTSGLHVHDIDEKHTIVANLSKASSGIGPVGRGGIFDAELAWQSRFGMPIKRRTTAANAHVLLICTCLDCPLLYSILAHRPTQAAC